MNKLEEKAIETVKSAYRNYFLDKDTEFILEHSLTNDDIPLYGIVKPDWDGKYAIISEYEKVQNISEDTCIVSSRISLKDITKAQVNEETLVNGTFVCRLIDDSIKFLNIHLSRDNGITYGGARAISNDSDYKKALKSIFNVVFEYDSLNNTFSYDPVKCRDFFQIDTHFVSMDQWFWNMCTECVHAEDVELMDIFRSNDIGKRIRDGDLVVNRDIRIRNREKGFIWVKMIVVFVPNMSCNYVEKVFALFKNIDEEKNREMDYIVESTLDKMTGLYNKSYIKQSIREFLKTNPNDVYSFIIVDVDNYRQINDIFGRISGNDILIKLAKLIEDYTENNDVVGRINGDEFAIFAKFVNDPEELKVKVSNFLDKIVFEHCEDGKSHMVKCSAGVAISGSDVDSLEALYEKAEKNLYEAKEMGRHSFKIS